MPARERGPPAPSWVPATATQVSVYDPHPTSGQLETAGQDYPDTLIAATGRWCSRSAPPFRPAEVRVPDVPLPRAAGGASAVPSRRSAASFVKASPYGRAYALATATRAQGHDAVRIRHERQVYLSHGFSYNENTPEQPVPAGPSFLFTDKYGYCQQFAGAMALLLRMGGIPARVAVGFTTGSYNTSDAPLRGRDIDAHAWVEAWFPHYGWVRFDPTPAVAPARGGKVPILPAAVSTRSRAPAAPGCRGLGSRSKAGDDQPPPTAPASRPGRASSRCSLAVAVVALVLALTRAPRQPTSDELLARARAGARPQRAPGRRRHHARRELERRFRIAPDAAAYVRTLRVARFGGAPASANSGAAAGAARAAAGRTRDRRAAARAVGAAAPLAPARMGHPAVHARPRFRVAETIWRGS